MKYSQVKKIVHHYSVAKSSTWVVSSRSRFFLCVVLHILTVFWSFCLLLFRLYCTYLLYFLRLDKKKITHHRQKQNWIRQAMITLHREQLLLQKFYAETYQAAGPELKEIVNVWLKISVTQTMIQGMRERSIMVRVIILSRVSNRLLSLTFCFALYFYACGRVPSKKTPSSESVVKEI